MERKISTPWIEQGCTFRVIPTNNGYELQRRKSSNILNNCQVWKYVKDFQTLQEVNDYLDDLGNAVINLTLEASSAFLIIDACSCLEYDKKTLLTQHELIVLRRIIQLIENNLKEPK